MTRVNELVDSILTTLSHRYPHHKVAICEWSLLGGKAPTPTAIINNTNDTVTYIMLEFQGTTIKILPHPCDARKHPKRTIDLTRPDSIEELYKTIDKWVTI